MYIFHGNLEAIETASFCDLHFLTEPLHLEETNKHFKSVCDFHVRCTNAVWISYGSAHKILRLIYKAATPQNLKVFFGPMGNGTMVVLIPH